MTDSADETRIQAIEAAYIEMLSQLRAGLRAGLEAEKERRIWSFKRDLDQKKTEAIAQYRTRCAHYDAMDLPNSAKARFKQSVWNTLQGDLQSYAQLIAHFKASLEKI